jgi:LPXTG-site transpeptidase (sortase) family protein
MGNSLISGHLDTKTNPRSVFYNLQKLNPGDSVIITDTQGHIIEFKVTGKKVYGYKEKVDGLFAHVSDRNLNLITCTGKWLPSENTYDKRLVVFAKMID